MVVPPAYPTRVLYTPFCSPNRASGPQNQPKAKVAIASFFEAILSIIKLLFSCDILLPPMNEHKCYINIIIPNIPKRNLSTHRLMSFSQSTLWLLLKPRALNAASSSSEACKAIL